MANRLYVIGTEPRTGKSAVILFLMEQLIRNIRDVAFFRPIINVEDPSLESDNTINLIKSHFKLNYQYQEMYACTVSMANQMISVGKSEELQKLIMSSFNNLESKSDFILCEGVELEGATASFDFDLNAEIANNIGCPVLLVAQAKAKTVANIVNPIKLYHESFYERKCDIIATIINRVDPALSDEIRSGFQAYRAIDENNLFLVPNEETLGSPSVGEIASLLNARVLFGKQNLTRHVHSFTVAAMQLRNLLDRIEHGTLIITPGDRSDVILACLAAVESQTMPNISGILLTGGLLPEPPILRVIEGFSNSVPIIAVNENTFDAAVRVDKIHSKITPDNIRKITMALAFFERHLPMEGLGNKIITTKTNIVTPLMFEARLLHRAKASKRHIVLPEGEEDRILQAAEALLQRGAVDITLLGDKEVIKQKAASLNLRLNNVSIVDPRYSNQLNEYSETYFSLRKNKGVTPEQAKDQMLDVNYFGTMMIYKSHADGMVSGAAHTTADTIRPAFQFIKTEDKISVISSVFLMCLSDRVLAYGDCAIVPEPTAEELAEIAISSARTASLFEITPVVAMLSYSSGSSGSGIHVDKIREATRLARKKAEDIFPGLEIDGPIQYDAAIDPVVAATKMPESKVAGKATVFIFPDLNTGNNTYKAVQRSAGAVAIGPILQGLRKPVNDLSRGCSVTDIVNTVAITAIQAQS